MVQIMIFLGIALGGAINALNNAPPHEGLSTQDRPSWCENRASFGMSARDREACGI